MSDALVFPLHPQESALKALALSTMSRTTSQGSARHQAGVALRAELILGLIAVEPGEQSCSKPLGDERQLQHG